MVTDVEKDFCEHEVGGEIYTEDTATAEASLPTGTSANRSLHLRT